MFTTYDPDGFLEDALSVPTPSVPAPSVSHRKRPSAPLRTNRPSFAPPPPSAEMPTAPLQMTAQEYDFPLFVGDRVRVLHGPEPLLGHTGLIVGLIRSLVSQKAPYYRVLFACGTTAGLAHHQLEFDPHSPLISDDLLDAVLCSSRPLGSS